jgi:cephalosporin hydroxylase
MKYVASSAGGDLTWPAATPLERHLDTPLRNVLPLIQQRMVTRSSYFGVPAWKSPTDAWVYRELIVAQRPDVIVEIGNKFGGGLLALAHTCDLLDYGRVIGVDIDQRPLHQVVRDHPRVELFEGDAVTMFAQVAAGIGDIDNVLVIDDSAHTFDNTLAVLRTYSDLVPVGGYFIVEDTICHHGLDVGPKPGPYEAVDAFLAETNAFVRDATQEDFVVGWNPGGYLRRLR